MEKTPTTQMATFAAGCFWGVEEAFRHIPGVIDTTVGFMGGSVPDPSYKDVCTGTTGHAEVVTVTYDPSVVTYEDLLTRFWNTHDPTQLNRQGPDVGAQYRSAIFYHTNEQKGAAIRSKQARESSGEYTAPIVTEIVAAEPFYKAEEYHQQYFAKRGGGVCHV